MVQHSGLCDKVSIDVGRGITNRCDVNNALHIVNDAASINHYV